MKEFIDETSTVDGTPINRANLMAIQGFIAKTTTFNDDDSITETNSSGETKTTSFLSDGSIVEVFTGKKVITKKTMFNTQGDIVEVLE